MGSASPDLSDWLYDRSRSMRRAATYLEWRNSVEGCNITKSVIKSKYGNVFSYAFRKRFLSPFTDQQQRNIIHNVANSMYLKQIQLDTSDEKIMQLQRWMMMLENAM